VEKTTDQPPVHFRQLPWLLHPTQLPLKLRNSFELDKGGRLRISDLLEYRVRVTIKVARVHISSCFNSVSFLETEKKALGSVKQELLQLLKLVHDSHDVEHVELSLVLLEGLVDQALVSLRDLLPSETSGTFLETCRKNKDGLPRLECEESTAEDGLREKTRSVLWQLHSRLACIFQLRPCPAAVDNTCSAVSLVVLVLR